MMSAQLSRLALAATLIGCAAAAPPAVRPSADPIVIAHNLVALEVESGVFRVTHTLPPAPANSLVYVTEGGAVVLADTPWTPAATRELLAWVEVRFGGPPALAILTHFHLDAAGGVGALREAGVRVVASRETASLLQERGESMRVSLAEGDAAFEGWSVGEAGELFDAAEGFRATVGGEAVQAIFPGAAHTRDNLVVYFPARRVLFGGCMVKGGDNLGNLVDADIAAYASSVARLEALGARLVVPGHGERLDLGQLAHTRRMAEDAANE